MQPLAGPIASVCIGSCIRLLGRMQLLAFFSLACRIPGFLAHIPKKNANFATPTHTFPPFQQEGSFLYKPMNDMTEKQPKTEKQQRIAAEEFARKWEGRGYEKGESQPFWMDLLTNVFGIQHAAQFISFENQVKLACTSFIDGYIESTHVLIEQKSIDKDLTKPIRQSDGSLLTPFQQAKRYAAELPYSKRPRWVVVCNFRSFLVYDMEHPHEEPEQILLKDLPTDYYRLHFLVDDGKAHLKKEMEVSIQAGNLVGIIYDKLLAQYLHPEAPETLKSLNVLCVRLVFCLYAEDAGVFGRHSCFHDYLAPLPPERIRRALLELFRVLNTPVQERDPYLEPELAAFPYVNGVLFADEHIEIPHFTDELKAVLLTKASDDFDWSQISPTIFGAVFESTLNPETRRKGGMHYTSIENIHKVIDPLFLDDLHHELAAIREVKVEKTRKQKLLTFQEKLAALRFLDPACGSGNFLTETYLSLRRLENAVLQELFQGQSMLGAFKNPIRVGIHQFYGIELNDFAVTVAKTALWIAEAQMMTETERIVQMNLDFLPLKNYGHIVEGNALRIDWAEVIPAAELDYIIGNPPFVGYSLQGKEQKEDILSLYVDEKGKPYKTAGKIDYVAGWYFKAAQLMAGTRIRTAFVSTNSICQGEQVAGVWKPLYGRFGIHIDFAWNTFKWDSQSNQTAAVHVIIVGFSCSAQHHFSLHAASGKTKTATTINPYLMDAPVIFVEGRSKPLGEVAVMQNGGKPAEGGNLILTQEEKEELLAAEPQAEPYLRPYMMGKDFIDRKTRYCLWLVHAHPKELRNCPLVMERVKRVREFRLASPKAATRKKADTPTLFDEVRECATDYIAVPKVSSENRKYIPMEYLKAEIIAGDKLFMVQNGTLYDFGILTSSVHMAWMRTVCGRLKSDYSYSNTIVYNNFPWPSPSEAQRQRITQTAQAILDARALYPDASLADLYDEVVMPPELRKVHQENDRAVMVAYGFPVRDFSESDCVARLFQLYAELNASKGGK